ncbi:hypothetical protein [Corynebacterium sp. H113]|uniref:hypothetical protein n=1 Tax=Corynebacterium sp. H113 TaxID=3133419 RepID=UPI0030AEE062
MVEFKMPAELRLQLKDQWDIRSTQRGVLVMEGGNTITTDIPAIKGDQGDPGRDGVPPRFHAPVTVAELPNPGALGVEDVGWMWPIKGSTTVYQFNGYDLVPLENYLGARGPIGPAPAVRVGEIHVDEVPGVATRQDVDGTVIFDFTIPRGQQGVPGQKGETGDSASISSAVDYDDGGVPAVVGDVLTMRADGDWGPAKPQIAAGTVKKYGADSDWEAVNTGVGWRGDYVEITKLTIPPQAYPWEPEVFGMVDAKVDGIMVRIDIEARLNAVSGPLLALGAGPESDGVLGDWVPRQLMPAADETASFNDSSSVVQPGREAVIYLIARRVESLSAITLQTRKERAYLRVNVTPVRVEGA